MRNKLRIAVSALFAVLVVAAGVLAGGVASSTLMIPNAGSSTELVPVGYVPATGFQDVRARDITATTQMSCQQNPGFDTETFGRLSAGTGFDTVIVADNGNGGNFSSGVALGKNVNLTADGQFVVGGLDVQFGTSVLGAVSNAYFGAGVAAPDLTGTQLDFTIHATGGVYVVPLPDPAAPAVTLVPGGGTFAGGVTGFKVAWENKYLSGETLPSPATAIALGAGDSANVDWGPAPAGTQSVHVYSEDAPGSGVYKLASIVTLTGPTSGLITAPGFGPAPRIVNDTGSAGGGHALIAAGGDADPVSAPAIRGGPLRLRPGLSSDAATAGSSVEIYALLAGGGQTPTLAWVVDNTGALVAQPGLGGVPLVIGPSDADLLLQSKTGWSAVLSSLNGACSFTASDGGPLFASGSDGLQIIGVDPFLDLDTSAAAVSAASHVRLRSDGANLQASVNGAAYFNITAGGGNPPQFNFTQNSLALANGSNHYDFTVGGFTLYCWSAVVWPGDAGNIVVSVSQSRVGADTARITINYTYTAGTAGQVDVILFYL